MMKKNQSAPRKILVIRFRQLGDAVLATTICNSLKATFPEAQVDFVLNSGLAPIFEGNPCIDNIITFSKEQNASFPKYLRRIWSVMRRGKYDMIIDTRSTLRTLIFSLFSPATRWRIGKKKWYSTPFLTHVIDNRGLMRSEVERNIRFLLPLKGHYDVKEVPEISLAVTEQERDAFREKMVKMGVDPKKPIMLVGVTTKLLHKCFPMDKMKGVLQTIIKRYPEWQFIFNYSPGREEEDARALWEELGRPEQVKIDVEAKGVRELAVMISLADLYFGNEGGSRHIAQALGVPSLALFSQVAPMTIWMPKTSTPAQGFEFNETHTPEVEEIVAALTPLMEAKTGR